MIRLLALLAVLAIGLTAPIESSLADPRTFDSPLHDGLPLDYCGAAADSCGEFVATAWCRAQGYEQATEWAARAGVDSASRTVRLDDGAVCRGADCESFATITCDREGSLSESLDAAGVELSDAEFARLLPGCRQIRPGAFSCASVTEYEHCRTSMISRLVASCRADVPFDSTVADFRPAAPGEYRLEVDSNARARIDRGSRGLGRARGKARVELVLEPPSGRDCVQRAPFIYYPTGPKGGLSEIGEAAACEEPLEFSFEVHRDDLLLAYDACESRAAWGSRLEGSIEVVAAALFDLESGRVAPFLTVTAPLTIDCRD